MTGRAAPRNADRTGGEGDGPTPFNRLWPQLQVMTLPAARVLYLPIAKNACTSLKTLMVELSDLPAPRRAAVLRDVHGVLDAEETGLQLKDHPEERARAMLAAEGWLRAAVLRDPVERLVSAYVEKFVIRRERKRIATAPVIAAIRGVAEPGDADFARGIRFAEFLEHVCASPPEALDPHWRDQADSFAAGIWTDLYAIEHLGLLAADLSARLGRPVRIGGLNRARPEPKRVLPGAAALWPADLPEPERLAPESFVDAAARARIEARCALDATLHRAALRENALRLRLGETRAPAAPAPE